MSIPLMVVVIAAIFFFGWVMRNAQRVRIADRYTSWKSVYDHYVVPSEQQINEKFFAGRGYDIYVNVNYIHTRSVQWSLFKLWMTTVSPPGSR